MDELDNRRKLDVLLCYRPKRRGCQKRKQRAQPLPAGIDDVLANVFDHFNIRMKLFDNERVDLSEFRFNAGSNLIYHNTSPGRGGSIKAPRLSCHEVGYSRIDIAVSLLRYSCKRRILRALVYEQHSSAYALPRIAVITQRAG